MADSKYTSEVWNYFTVINRDAVEKKTQYKLCDIKLNYKFGSTKSMWNHLKSKHPNAVAESKSQAYNS